MAEQAIDPKKLVELYPSFPVIAQMLKVDKLSVARVIADDILSKNTYRQVSELPHDLSSKIGEVLNGSISIASFLGLLPCECFIRHNETWYSHDSQGRLIQVEIKSLEDEGLMILNIESWLRYEPYAILVPIET